MIFIFNFLAGQPESFDSYPHADILNEIGGRKAWHHDYGRPNEEKVIIQKLHNNYGFKYTLEAPTSSSVRYNMEYILIYNSTRGYYLIYILVPAVTIRISISNRGYYSNICIFQERR